MGKCSSGVHELANATENTAPDSLLECQTSSITSSIVVFLSTTNATFEHHVFRESSTLSRAERLPRRHQ